MDSGMDGVVRTGVVGLGYFGSFHVKHYAASPLARLVAVADASPRLGAAVRETFGAETFTDHRDLIGKVDAVSIAAPTSLHHPIAADFIDAGIHVLVEKPVTDRADTARDLVRRAERRGVVFHVGHIERFSPTFVELRRRMGQPRLLELTRDAPWVGRITDVDVVLDVMIHDIDLALALAGAEVAEVTAGGADLMGFGLDTVTALLRFRNGVVARISASRIAPAPRREVRVIEAGRALTGDLMARKLAVFDPSQRPVDGKPATVFHDIPAEDALAAEIRAFLTAVAGGASGGVDGRAALAALDVAERIREAASTQTTTAQVTTGQATTMAEASIS